MHFQVFAASETARLSRVTRLRFYIDRRGVDRRLRSPGCHEHIADHATATRFGTQKHTDGYTWDTQGRRILGTPDTTGQSTRHVTKRGATIRSSSQALSRCRRGRSKESIAFSHLLPMPITNEGPDTRAPSIDMGPGTW